MRDLAKNQPLALDVKAAVEAWIMHIINSRTTISYNEEGREFVETQANNIVYSFIERYKSLNEEPPTLWSTFRPSSNSQLVVMPETEIELEETIAFLSEGVNNIPRHLNCITDEIHILKSRFFAMRPKQSVVEYILEQRDCA